MWNYLFTLSNTEKDSKKPAKEYHILMESSLPPPEKILKAVFAFILCVIVLGSGLVSRISLHILLWHIQPPVISTNTLNQLGGFLEPNCLICLSSDITLSNSTAGWTMCTISTEITPVDEKWIWATFLVVNVPNVFMFFSTGFRVFKSNNPLIWQILLPESKITYSFL